MKITIIALILIITGKLMANEHALGAHEHGSIKLGMALEKNTVEIDIDGPAESFLGFEYLPKTAGEKKVFRNLELKWTKNLETLISFSKKINCKVTEASFKQVIEEKETVEKQAKIKNESIKETGVHSDIEAKAKLTCTGELNGSEVMISLKKTFKHIKKLSVEIIGKETKSIEITQEVQTIQI